MRLLERGLSPDPVRQIVKRRHGLAGYEAIFASLHGLRFGFRIQAALDVAENPATDLLG